MPLLNSLVLRIIWGPREAWLAVRSADPGWQRSLLGHAAPLAFIPALGWPLGDALDPAGPAAVASASSLAAAAITTFVLCLATVVVVAGAIYALAPEFGAPRHWNRAVAVAAYSSTPVLLAVPLLASATLTILFIASLFHACLLCGLGLQRLVGCRGEDAAMYVAAVGFVAGIAGLVLGGLSSAVGIL